LIADKEPSMALPAYVQPALLGAAAGAAVLAFAGFTWAGWVTGATAERNAALRADTAVVAALAPVCVDRFDRASNATANRAALKLIDSWAQGDYIEKGGWAASLPPERVPQVAKACAELLALAPVAAGPGVRP
jgi:hypothetical protein